MGTFTSFTASRLFIHRCPTKIIPRYPMFMPIGCQMGSVKTVRSASFVCTTNERRSAGTFGALTPDGTRTPSRSRPTAQTEAKPTLTSWCVAGCGHTQKNGAHADSKHPHFRRVVVGPLHDAKAHGVVVTAIDVPVTSGCRRPDLGRAVWRPTGPCIRRAAGRCVADQRGCAAVPVAQRWRTSCRTKT